MNVKYHITGYLRANPAMQKLARVLVLLVAAAAPFLVVAGDVLHGHGLLWQVEKPGNDPSYVFATVHSEDRRVLDLPGLVRERLDAAAVVVIEAQVDSATSLQSMQAMLFTEGTRLSDVLQTGL